MSELQTDDNRRLMKADFLKPLKQQNDISGISGQEEMKQGEVQPIASNALDK